MNETGTGESEMDQAGAGEAGGERSRDGWLDPGFSTPIYLTGGEAPIGGVIKARPEDFLVEEMPLYAPCGEGEHIYLFVEKRGLSTIDLVTLLTKRLGVPRVAVGIAGLKDKHAVTRQVVSIDAPGRSIDALPPIDHPSVRVLWADRHTNKLRRGHLAGNRFSIRVRGVDPTRAVAASRILERLAREGVPNRVGEQRFGYLLNNHLVGRCLYLGDLEGAVAHLLGPHPRSPEAQSAAREAYASGNLAAAAATFPRRLRTEWTLLEALARGVAPADAWRRIDPSVRGYYYSAFQSAVFNHVLDARLTDGTFGTLLPGDLAWRDAGRVSFRAGREAGGDVPPELAEDAAQQLVSPTGPMWGPTMPRADGDVDRLECACLARAGCVPSDLQRPVDDGLDSIDGTRRPLRVRLSHPEVEGGVDEHGPYVRCAFDLPRGSFATTVMREIMKPADELPEAGS